MIHVVLPPFRDSWGAVLHHVWRGTGGVHLVGKEHLQATKGDVVYFLDFHDDMRRVQELVRSGVVVGGHVHGSSFDRMDPFLYRYLGPSIDYHQHIRSLVKLERETLASFSFLTLNSTSQLKALRKAGVPGRLFVSGFPVIVPVTDEQPGRTTNAVLIQQRVMHDKQVGLAIELSYRLRAAGMEPTWLGPWNDQHANIVAFAEVVHDIPVVQYDYPEHWPTVASARASITTCIHDTLGVRIVETLMMRRPFYVPDLPPLGWVPAELRYRPYDLDHMVSLLTQGVPEDVLQRAYQQAMQYEAPSVIKRLKGLLLNVASQG